MGLQEHERHPLLADPGRNPQFYAYAPYTKNGVAIPVAYTKGDGMIMTDYTVPADDAGQVDLMYASALNVAKASPAVKVPSSSNTR